MIIILLAAFCFFTRETMRCWFQPVSIVGNDSRKSVSSSQTTSSYRYSTQFNKTLNNARYTQFRNIYQPEMSTAIPGLASTDILGINCDRMVPQGICIAGDYMIVSAYDSGSNRPGQKKQRSVLYVLSNKDAQKRTYLTTIVLPDINHVGGLAYDGKYLWIAKSTTKTCSAIDMRLIERAAASGQNSCEVEYTATVSCGMTASFLTYYDNRLWIGTFANKSSREGKLVSFNIVGSGKNLTLEKVNCLTIPYNANGVNIEEMNGQVCMAVVSSFSRTSDTVVYLYELDEDDTEEITKVYRGRYQFPPMGEEVASDGEHAYFLFESAATCYSEKAGRKCNSPVDRICAVKMSDLYYWSDIALLNGELPAKEAQTISIAKMDMVLPKDTYDNMRDALKEENVIEYPIIAKRPCNSGIITNEILYAKRLQKERAAYADGDNSWYRDEIVSGCHIRAA
jgi:hypothetical protein